MATNIYLYGMFEQNYATYDVESELADLLAWQADIVVVQLGDNVAASLSSQEAIDAYTASYTNLLTAFKKSSQQPAMFALSTWWTDETTDDIMDNACTEVGISFVSIDGLYDDTANRGGWGGGHPNDAGMAAIADTLLSTMGVHAPEPNTLVLLVMAGLLLGVGWTRKHFNDRTRERR